MARFTASELEAIREAVRRAESRTSGEIVPYVVSRSDAHESILWRGAAAGVVLGLVGILVVRLLFAGWSTPALHSAWIVHVFMAGGAAIGLALARFSPPVFRLLAGRAFLDRIVHDRAVRAFVEDEVFDTRDRTGIVLLVSLLERRIVVLGDAGINAHVRDEDWAGVIDIARDGIRAGRPAQALAEAIDRCGDLLAEMGVERREDDRNELSDRLRTDADE